MATQQPVDAPLDFESAFLLRCPIGVLRKIAELLPPASKKSMRATCTPARDAVDQQVRHLDIDRALVTIAPHLARYKDSCLVADDDPFPEWGETILPPFLHGVLTRDFPCLTSLTLAYTFTIRQLAQAPALGTRLTSLSIKHFGCLPSGKLPLLVDAFPRLTHLHALLDVDTDWPPPSLAPLTALPNLASLSLNLVQSRTHSDPNNIIDPATYFPCLPAITSLRLTSVQLPMGDVDGHPLQHLAAALPALQALTLFHIFLTYDEENVTPDALVAASHIEVHSQDFSPLTTLTALHTNDVRYHSSRSILTLPRLRSLTLDPLDDDNSSTWFRGFPAITRGLWRALPPAPLPPLTALSLPADLLPDSPTPFTALTSLTVTFPACAREGARAAPVLAAIVAATPPPTLRALHVTARAADPPAILSTLLASLPALSVLCLAHNSWSLELVQALCAHTTLRQLELYGTTDQPDSLVKQWLALLPARLPHLDPCRWTIAAKALNSTTAVVAHTSDGELQPPMTYASAPEKMGYLDKASEDVVDRPAEGEGETYVDEHGTRYMSYYDSDSGRYMWASMDDYYDDDDDGLYGDDTDAVYDEHTDHHGGSGSEAGSG